MSSLSAQLETRLSSVFGDDLEVSDLTRLTGGASRETWSFTAALRRTPGGAAGGTAAAPDPGLRRHRLVLRRDPPGAGRPDRMAREAAAIAAAERAGVPVPHLVDHGPDPSVVGAPYLITEHVDGETIVRRLQRDDRYATARENLAAELGRALARIHAIPVDAVPGLETVDPLETLRANHDALGEPLPTVEIALRWLAARRPAPVVETVVHGDFRAGNVIVDETGLRAVIDWERVHRGDPREDLGWVCVKAWRFGSALAAGGFGTLEQLLDGYADVAGHRPDPDAVRWWQIWGSAWWAVGCRIMAERHLSGETRSVELAAIGRRVCEQEHDVLLELGLPASPAAEPGPPESSGLHGRPTASELVAAVAEFLRDDVMPATDGRLSFLARVAANALDGVQRELVLGHGQENRHRARLAAFGQVDQAGLAAALRSGELDAADPALLDAVRADVADRLAVANPRYLEQP